MQVELVGASISEKLLFIYPHSWGYSTFTPVIPQQNEVLVERAYTSNADFTSSSFSKRKI